MRQLQSKFKGASRPALTKEYISAICKGPAELRRRGEQIREVLALFYSQVSALKFEVLSKRRLVDAFQSEIATKRAYCALLTANLQKTLAALEALEKP